MMDYSKLAPTPLNYFNCPGAVNLEEPKAEQSEAASEGTLAHEMAELGLVYSSSRSRRFTGKKPNISNLAKGGK